MRLAALVLIGMLLPASPAAAKPCKVHPRDEVVTATKSAVIAQRPNGHHQSTYRGCLKSAGRWRTLLVGDYDGYGGTEPEIPAIGGRYAGVLAFEGEHYGSGTYWVELVNLRTGHHRGRLAIGTADGMSGPHQLGITSFVISRYATIGWITAETWEDTTGFRAWSSVLGHDARGTRALDNTAGQQSFADLRFRGATLHWTHDGDPREAQVGSH